MSDERAARYSDLFGPRHDDAPACAYCPLCTAISLVRDARPEVLDHLAAAVRELAAAAAVVLEEAERVVGAPDGVTSAPGPDGDGRVVSGRPLS
ncbi:MAG TPA: hypothetical protein VHJ34_15825 [Actinomycetota bacterium]|nr:hypothetical protein [Actinomycetota bacterium]